MKDKYIYPAVFDFADDGISVEFPDLPGCLTCGDTVDEATDNAHEALQLHLFGMESDNETIPTPTAINQLHVANNQAIILVEVYMPAFRERMNKRTVKKTLTIPSWINAEAERAGLNFSQILQNALKQHLHITE